MSKTMASAHGASLILQIERVPKLRQASGYEAACIAALRCRLSPAKR